MANLTMIIVLIFSLIFVEGEQIGDFELTIRKLEKPINLITKYSLKKDCLIITKLPYFSLNESEKSEDKRLFKYELKEADKSLIFKLTNELRLDRKLEEIYINTCLIDGLELYITFKYKGTEYSTYVNNYYEPSINTFVQIVNEFSPKEYRIWYDEIELKKQMKDCN